MSPTTFFLFTIMVGSGFAYVLLWVIAECLKAEEETETLEREVREAVQKLVTADCRDPKPGCCQEYDEIPTTTAA